MKELLSELYQVLGELNAPANVLDQVAAAAAGQPLPHATLLPFAADADPIGHTTGTMHGDVNGNTFFEVKLAGRRRLPFMGQSVYVGSPPAGVDDLVQQLLAALKGVTLTQEQIDMGTAAGEEQHALARQVIANSEQAQQAAIKDSLTTDQQAEPVAWVRFCSDGCYEGPLMNSSPAMDGARRTSGAWTPLFAAQPVARDVLLWLAVEVRETCWQVGSGDATIRELDLAAIVDRYAARLPVEMHSTDLNDRKAEIIKTHGFEVGDFASIELKSAWDCHIGMPRPPAQPVARDVLMAAMRAAVAECAEVCDVYSSYKGARCASEIRHPIMNDKLAVIADRYGAAPQAVAAPDGYALVPVEPTRAMLDAAKTDLVRDGEIDPMLKGIYRAMLAAAPQAAAIESEQWPKERDVGRIGDMSQVASLRVGLDADSDVYVCIHGEAGSGSVEFCVPSSGGGKSPRTRAALIALMVAMEADNAESPSRDWWKAREGDAQKGGA